MILAVVRRVCPSLAGLGLIASGLLALSAPAALAQSAQRPAARPAAPAKPAAAAPAKPPAAPAGKPAAAGSGPIAGGSAVETVGDWTVYTAQRGRSKICYALTEPKARLPKTLDRDKAYLFVTVSPSENVRNEIALVMGFSANETAPAQATVGTVPYALVTKDKNAWLKNPAEENKAIVTMTKGQALVVNVLSRRGNKLTDRYSLTGFGPALERARKECAAR